MSKKQTAVLVDAGYFFAQATEVLFGTKLPRHEVEIDEEKVLLCIEELTKHAFPGREILRVYWYDAPPSKQVEMSLSQERLALKSGVKLRLGSLNGSGQQKGVDALIIHDLTQLARDGAADRFMLMSGDEDLRLAVEQAQACGAQVRLMSVGPGPASVGHALRREVDGIDRFDATWLTQCVSTRSAPSEKERGGSDKTAKKTVRKVVESKARSAKPMPIRAVSSNSQSKDGRQINPQGSARAEPPVLLAKHEQQEHKGPDAKRSGDPHQYEGVGRTKRRRSRGKKHSSRQVETLAHKNGGNQPSGKDVRGQMNPPPPPDRFVKESVPAPAPAPAIAPALAAVLVPTETRAVQEKKTQVEAIKKVPAVRNAAKKALPSELAPVKKVRSKKSANTSNQET